MAKERASSRTQAGGQPDAEKLSRQASIAHLGDVTRPAEAMFHHHGLNTNSVGLLQEGGVCDVVVPFDVEDGAELSLVELLELLNVLLEQCLQASQP